MSPQAPTASHPPLDRLPDAVERVAASVAGLALRRQPASGVVWQPGVIVTCASAVWRVASLPIVLPGGEMVEGRVRGIDAATDLAAITFETPAADAAAMPRGVERASASAPRVGDFVFAVGRSASGLVQASFGHVGAAAGEWRTWRGGRVERLIRLDGGLYPGLAGALVADADGRCLGVASPALSRHHGIVLPVATIERLLPALLEHGQVRRAYLGIAAQPVRAQLDGHGIDGLLLSSVAEGSPAAKAGLWVGDIVIEAGGREVPSLGALRDALADAMQASMRAADGGAASLSLKLVRGGQALTVTAELAQRPARHCG